MRSFLISVRSLMVVVLVTASVLSPFSAEAAELSARQRQALVAQIEHLLKQIASLQAQLAKQRGAPLLSGNGTIYRSRFFDVPLESVYRVRDNRLVRLDVSGGAVRPIDQQLFTFFQGVVGKAAVDRHVEEFRVFTGDIEELSAFVETKGGSDEWIVGVNRNEFDVTDSLTRQSFAELFVHEYAHLLFLENDEFVDDFRTEFWTAADMRHSERVANLTNRWDALTEYYNRNPTRFVSEYATMNVDEDMAESFQFFVLGSRPGLVTVRDQKIVYFYENADMVAARTVLRANLRAMGISLR